MDGVSAAQVDLQLPAVSSSEKWTAKAEDGGVGPGFCVVRCQVEGELNREVRLWTSGWSGIVQRTGSKPEYGPDACEFAPLGAGRYTVEPSGLDASAGASLRIDFDLLPNRIVWVRYHKAAQPVGAPPARCHHGKGD